MVRLSTGLSLLAATIAPVWADEYYTDPKSGIKFYQQEQGVTSYGPSVFTIGWALPDDSQSQYQNEFIGRIVTSLNNGAGYAGLGIGGSMPNSLLFMFWPNAGKLLTSFRYAAGYNQPDIYNGNATATIISQTVNSSQAEIIFRCQNCWTWSQSGGTPGSAKPAAGPSAAQGMAWAMHTAAPLTPANPDSLVDQHAYQGIYGAQLGSAKNSAYTSWVAKATATASGTGSVTTTAKPTATATKCAASQAAPTDTYDYIVVGGGAGGIPIAAKLSENGANKVLLVEKGPPSSGRWGGNLKPNWLSGTNLTRFDVPGLCNQIWHDSAGISCTDAPTMAGCVLGGGTAVNAGLWWKPNPDDWDQVWPAGWRSAEMAQAITRTFQKIPGTYIPSMDGKTYYRQDFTQVANALTSAGWTSIDANANPSQKNHTFTQTPYMFSNGERGGPMATYLVEASKRSNFKLLMNTVVKRVVRDGAQASGVEVEAFNSDGKCGTIRLSSKGRVIIAAGAYGTPKVLFRSGIGPSDMLNVVKSSADGPTMISSNQWINLPVGNNANDHTNTNMVIQYNQSVFYDFVAAYNNPIPADSSKYLQSRSGILAQSAPNIGPIFFDLVQGSDGKARQLQWTARTEGDQGFPDNTSMVLSQYLGRGKTSSGRIVINPDLTMAVSQLPYANTQADLDAIAQGINNVKAVIAKNKALTLLFPKPDQDVASFVKSYPNTLSARSANHWIGTAKMGTDSGLNGGTSVVDTNTKVYGTNNIHVVDASVFPGMMSNNPSALIVAVAERAWEYISGMN